MADTTDAAVLITDAQGLVVYHNSGFSRMFGWTLDEVRGQHGPTLLARQASEEFFASIRKALLAGRSVKVDELIISKEGRRHWCNLVCNPVTDPEGEWLYTISVLLDITRTKIYEVLNNRVLEAMARDLPLIEVLEMVCEEVEQIAPEISASILQVDDEGVLHPLASPSLPFSYSSQLDGVVIGPSVGSCGTAAWRKEPVLVLDIATDPLWADYKHLILPLGYRSCWSTPIMNKDSKVLGTFAFYYRESGPHVASAFHQQLVQACIYLCALAMEREQTRLRIRHLAYYDALTGLPNRSLLQASADQLLQQQHSESQSAAVLFIDLDRFKHVNDSLGHSGGDALLCAVADRIKGLLRHAGIAGRLSGDEFVMVLPHTDCEHIGLLIERVQSTLTQPLHLKDTAVDVSASIGVAVYPQDGHDIETLIHRADMAMYQAKKAGRGRFSFFSKEMNSLAKERLGLEQALRQALVGDDGTLHLHYQPQVDIVTGRLYGVEALARWRHPLLGDISPERFIPLAEETGLIGILGHWAMKTACAQMRQWREAGLEVPTVAVNMSPLNFHNLHLPALVADTLSLNALPPSSLTLELTESLLLEANPAVLKTIETLNEYGVRLSLDDFGSGYSSLSYLRSLPISELKLDQSFVADLAHDAAERNLSAAILGIGESLGLTVIAEGVETTVQLETLREQGYPVVQGYLFSKPLSPTAFEQWLRASDFCRRAPPYDTGVSNSAA
ncbi:EAL domain-containing protein [Bordetella sp. 02P26C-1]|nr:EAL domain-containing protein [Bordetella sp. 02P26C-1]